MTPVSFAAYVDGERVELVGVRISYTEIEEKSHRSVFDFTKKFGPVPDAPASDLIGFAGLSTDGVGVAALADDVCFTKKFKPTDAD